MILVAMFCFAALYSFKILKNWDFTKTTGYQYSLEKKLYLVNTIIYFTIILKIFLFSYFIFSVDLLSTIIPGAMCAAGVFNFNEYGNILLLLKLLFVALSLLWLIVNKIDLSEKTFPYLKVKNYLFFFLFLVIISELILEVLYFSNLSTESLATCCSVLYDSSQSSPIPFSLSVETLLYLFFILFILLLISNYKNYHTSSFLLSMSFLYVSYFTTVYYFGTYIYQLPTHNCPFCMLQKEYLYVGYVLFAALFLGVFFSALNFLLTILINRFDSIYTKYANIFLIIFVIISCGYVGIYYLKNGVFL